MSVDSLKDTIRNRPALRRLARSLLKGLKSTKKQKEIATYRKWLRNTEPSMDELTLQREESRKFEYRPLISVVTPVYNTPATYFEAMVDSVRFQSYENWELVLVDDASPDKATRTLVEKYAALDNRIRYIFLEEGQHIAGATNVAIKHANGEFISLFDHDDVLLPNALYEVTKILNDKNNLDFIYTDEDKIIDGESLRGDPFFKPSWNKDFLYSVNYITHFTTIRKTILETAGYEDGSFNGAQDWELFFRIIRLLPAENIHHISKVLYSWRVHSNSTAQSLEAKPYVLDAQKRAIAEDLRARGINNFILSQDELYPAQWKVDFPLKTPVEVTVINPKQANLVEAIERATSNVLIFTSRKPKTAPLIKYMGDCFREDIGFVVPRVSGKKEVMMNIRQLLSKEASDYIESFPDSLSYHYYRTTRYNIPEVVDGSIVIIETDKAKVAIKKVDSIESVSDIARQLSKDGYRHLYSPYIKV